MSAIAKRLVDGADAALSSLANRHEDLPVHGRIDADTVPETTKLGRPSHLSSGYGRCRKGAPIRALPASSSPTVRMTGRRVGVGGPSGRGTIRRSSCWLCWRVYCPPAQARQSCPAVEHPPPARAGLFCGDSAAVSFGNKRSAAIFDSPQLRFRVNQAFGLSRSFACRAFVRTGRATSS
jgi:hypothetical protein